tara:strand:- start:123 stop:1442 length:1320 start_codon:yes stop_codon:yes gene_type:complete
MEITVEKPSELERCLKINLPEDLLEGKVLSRLNDLQKTARLDGFRKGKIPPKIIRQRFGQQVRAEVVGELVQSSFGEAVQKESLRPAGQPAIDDLQSEVGAGLSFTAKFEVFPDFALKSLDGTKVEKNSCVIEAEDIDKVLERLRTQNQTWIEKKAAAEIGDKLHISYRGLIDDEEFEGGVGEDENLVLGSKSMIEGFEDGLVGTTDGEEKTLHLRFPKKYHKLELSDKEVNFEIKVKSVKRSELPEVNEEFMNKFGVDDGSLESFRENLKGRLEKECQNVVERKLNESLIAALLETNKFEVPDVLKRQEAEKSKEQLMRTWFMRGKNPIESSEEFEKELEEEGEKRVRTGLIMSEIIKDADLKASPDKVQRAIEDIATSYEDSDAVKKWYYENQQQLQMIESQCLEQEVLTWVAEQVEVTEKIVSFDDLMDPMQTNPT